MHTKFLIIAGAGCTLSDATYSPISKKPPLDKGFFNAVSKARYSEFTFVRRYLEKIYTFDPTEPERDSLESVMAMIYADIHNPELESLAIPAFRTLIRLFNRRIAETTNELTPTNRSNLYRILCQLLDEGLSPRDICIITFNQDIQIEKALQKIQSTYRVRRAGRVFNFPLCYEIPDSHEQLSKPRSDVPTFEIGNDNDTTIRLLKLHGSLNWFSMHRSRNISKTSILSASRDYRITPRLKIEPDLTFTIKRKRYTFPLIIPPVTHKAGILHNDILPLWTKAAKALRSAHRIIVFGYSCPTMDFESANLIRRTMRQNKNLKEFNIIDPNPQVFQRYVDLTGLDRLYYYRTANTYLKA